jgi:putative heme-binding domain-containing protein
LAASEKLDRLPRKDSDEWAMDNYLAAALVNEMLPAEVRRWALRSLRADDAAITSARMRQWLASDNPSFRLAAVRTLRESDLRDRTELLSGIAHDPSNNATLRAEAVMGLPAFNAAEIKALVDLAIDDTQAISQEALRSLRGVNVPEAERQRLLALRQRNVADADLVDRVLHAGPAKGMPAPADTDRWLKLLEGPADPAAGERVFFHAKAAGCSRCHQREGRGGIVGPDLTVVGRMMDRHRLLESILQPSREVSPQFVVWTVETEDGEVRSGVRLGTRPNGDEIYYPEKGGTFAVRPSEIINKVASRTSVMPEGLETLMTLQEMRDLLAFLRR